MGETPAVCARRARRASRTPGTARSGPIDATGFDGQISLQDPRCGDGARRTLVSNALDLIPSPALHPVLLEVEVERVSLVVDHVQPGGQRIFGDRQDGRFDSESTRELGRHLDQAPPAFQRRGSNDVRRQIEVAEAEPRVVRAQRAQGLGGLKRLAGPAPPALAIHHACQPVHDRVEVRRDVQAVKDDVVPGVRHDRHLAGRDDSH
jgi:hypothetical protein